MRKYKGKMTAASLSAELVFPKKYNICTLKNIFIDDYLK